MLVHNFVPRSLANMIAHKRSFCSRRYNEVGTSFYLISLTYYPFSFVIHLHLFKTTILRSEEGLYVCKSFRNYVIDI